MMIINIRKRFYGALKQIRKLKEGSGNFKCSVSLFLKQFSRFIEIVLKFGSLLKCTSTGRNLGPDNKDNKHILSPLRV